MAQNEKQTSKVGKIFAQMTKILKDTSAIGKEKQAGGLAYAFRGIDDVYNEIHGTLSKHGVFTVPTVLEERSEERKSKSGNLLIYRILRIAYRFFADDGSFISSIVIGEGMDTGDKAANKAMSVAHKYALLQAFCIPTADTKDPEANHHEVQEKTEKSRKTTEKSAEKPRAQRTAPKANGEPPPIAKAVETDFESTAKPPSKFDTAVKMKIAGKLQNISYKEALDIYQKAKKFLGNRDYYAVLGDQGYEKSDEIPYKDLDKIYHLLIDRYNDKRDEKAAEKDAEDTEGSNNDGY